MLLLMMSSSMSPCLVQCYNVTTNDVQFNVTMSTSTGQWHYLGIPLTASYFGVSTHGFANLGSKLMCQFHVRKRVSGRDPDPLLTLVFLCGEFQNSPFKIFSLTTLNDFLFKLIISNLMLLLKMSSSMSPCYY